MCYRFVLPTLQFQSTHPYRVRPLDVAREMEQVAISIHSPIQGETFTQAFWGWTGVISIHSPIQGETGDMVMGVR